MNPASGYRPVDCSLQIRIGLSHACCEQSSSCIPKADGQGGSFRLIEVSTRPPAGPAETMNRGHHPGPIQGLHTTGRTPCGDKPERTTPSRSPFGARMQWPEPAHTEQSLARLARPTKGGAVRIRIALGTAVAVIAIPAIFFAFSSSSPAASARLSRQEASSQHQGAHMHHAVRINDTLMSYAQAQKAAAMVTYANAVKAAQVKTYLTEVAYLKAVAAQKQQQQLRQRQQTGAPRRRQPRHEQQRPRQPRRLRPPLRRHRHRSLPEAAPMPPAPTRPTGPASVSTNPAATTPWATAARTSSSSGRGIR